jgi:sugar transferase (PEP-CTERM/EpsH1 system associated)
LPEIWVEIVEDLLFLAHRIPYPPNKGDKIRSFNILRHLSRSYRVHLGAFVDDPCDMRYCDKVEALCASTCLLPLSPTRAKIRSLSGLIQKTALSPHYFYDKRMQQWVASRMASVSPQRVFVYSSPMAQYVLGENSSQIRRVIDFVDVDSDKWSQYADRKAWPLSWLYRREAGMLLQFERDIAMKFDVSLFVSAEEAALSRKLIPEAASSIHYFDNGVDHEFFTPDRDYDDPYSGCRDALVFTGAMDYWANIDAVKWFAQEVFPKVLAEVATTRFFIVGARPSREVQELSALPGVSVVGAVKDIRPYLAFARAAVAPLRIARGVQNKVLEAMAMARPVVATRVAVAGIDITGEDGLVIADNSDEFSEKTIRLLQSSGPSVFNNSRDWVCKRYDWEHNLRKLDEYLEARPQDRRHTA